MKRAQISVDTFILLAALAFAALVILAIVFPSVRDVLEPEGEKAACEWSLVMHSIAKLGDWSLIPPECRANRIEITMKDLRKYGREASKRIEVYKENPTKYEKMLKTFDDPTDPNIVDEWALNKIVAEEMKDCWEKVFKGRLPLFEKWWRLYSWDPVTGVPENQETAFELWLPLIGTQRFHGPPTNCVICSRIKFSDKVKKEFGSRININSLDLWLKYNYPKTGGKSYYDGLTEGQSELKGLFTSQYYYSIDEPLAVVYEKIYFDQEIIKKSDQLWKFVFGGDDAQYEYNFLKIIPYTQESLIHPPKEDGTGGEGCTFILD